MAAQPELHMVRISVDMRKFHCWSSERGLLHRSRCAEGIAMHHLLSECFGKSMLQPFRLMVARVGVNGSLYSYSCNNASILKDTLASTAPPEHRQVLNPSSIESKAMPVRWQPGHQLGFDVRARPVKRYRCSKNRIHEGDAFQREAKRHPPGEFAKSREEVYTEWLSEQFNRHGGATLETARLASFNRVRSAAGVASDQSSEGPDAIMHGMLKITSSEAFARLLARGIGRRRAYGYGMLLLRPPDTTAHMS